jgi:hypothetical protein
VVSIKRGAGRVTQVVEGLSSKCEALNSNPNPTKKKKKHPSQPPTHHPQPRSPRDRKSKTKTGNGNRRKVNMGGKTSLRNMVWPNWRRNVRIMELLYRMTRSLRKTNVVGLVCGVSCCMWIKALHHPQSSVVVALCQPAPVRPLLRI